jgi:hypothetical protein
LRIWAKEQKQWNSGDGYIMTDFILNSNQILQGSYEGEWDGQEIKHTCIFER